MALPFRGLIGDNPLAGIWPCSKQVIGSGCELSGSTIELLIFGSRSLRSSLRGLGRHQANEPNDPDCIGDKWHRTATEACAQDADPEADAPDDAEGLLAWAPLIEWSAHAI